MELTLKEKATVKTARGAEFFLLLSDNSVRRLHEQICSLLIKDRVCQMPEEHFGYYIDCPISKRKPFGQTVRASYLAS